MNEHKTKEKLLQDALASCSTITLSAVAELQAKGFLIVPPMGKVDADELKRQAEAEDRFYCSHCGAFKPSLMVYLQPIELPGIGTVQSAIVICGVESCRRVWGTMAVGIMPDQATMEAMRKAAGAAGLDFGAGLGGGRRGGLV